MKAPRPLEREVLKQCRDYLRLRGFLVIRINSGAQVGEYKGKKRFIRFNDTNGVSDLLALRDSTVIFIEVKRPGGKLSDHQAAFLDDVRRHGGVGICVSSVDDLRRQLETHGL